MSKKLPFELPIDILVHPLLSGIFKEAVDTVALHHGGEIAFDSQKFDGTHFKASAFFASEKSMTRFAGSYFMQYSNEFVLGELDVDPEILPFVMGLTVEVMSADREFSEGVIVLPRTSSNIGNLLYLAADEGTVRIFAAQIEACQRKRLREAAEYNDSRYLHIIAHRGEGILRGSWIGPPEPL